MKKILFAVLPLFILFCIGEEGPMGPTGPKGEKGLPGDTLEVIPNVIQRSGFLTSANIDTSGNFWDIKDLAFYFYNDSSVIQVFVRKGEGYMWIMPTWYLGNGYIRIIDDSNANMGDEYRYVVINMSKPD